MTTRIFLGLIGTMFAAFGLWAITQPEAMTAQLGVKVSGPAGLFEMRGVFGGISLGAAILCLGGAVRDTLTRPALFFVTTYMGGYMIGRAASFFAGDSAPMSSWMFAGGEALAFIIAATLLLRRA